MATTLLCSKCGIERELPDLIWVRAKVSVVCRDALACEIVQFMQEKGNIVSEAIVENDPEVYINKAKRLVAEVFNKTYIYGGPFPTGANPVQPSAFYVVWFAKTLGNWKALVSTDQMSGLYWEVTYDGNKKQTYIDSYSKVSNVAITDEGYSDFVNTI